jgi:hypothetical protein
MKTLSELWKEFDEKRLTLSPEGITDLQWHIEHDEDPSDAIDAARDMFIETVDPEWLEKKVISLMAKHLDNEDSMVRDCAVGAVIGICAAAEYGKKALVLARFDPDFYVRTTALSGLGRIINKVDPKLARKMAMHLYSVLTSPDENQFGYADRGASKRSVLSSMEVYYPDWKTANFQEVWLKFLKKYNLPEKEVVKVEKGW